MLEAASAAVTEAEATVDLEKAQFASGLRAWWSNNSALYSSAGITSAAFEALDAALASAEAALVDGPKTRPCATCGKATPVDEFPPFGRGTSKSCSGCVSDRAKRTHAKAKRITAATGRPVTVHGPRFPSNGGR
mgnify:CR=1 FL=1